MWEYFLKSGLCLFVLYSFYKLFLENEQFNYFKRFYLLAILLISIILPLLSFSYTVEIQTESSAFLNSFISSTNNVPNSSETITTNVPITTLVVYLLGLTIFAFRFVRNVKLLFQEINENEKQDQVHYILVFIRKKLSPHTFLKYIFLNKEEFENKEISSAIIKHEKVHVEQKHSLDLLFIEILQIIFWFNPALVWVKRSMKLNHEYLADNAVIKHNISASQYLKILYNYSSGHYHNSLSSPMSQSLIKKRILMISKKFSFRKMLFKLSMLIPVLAICIYFFSNEIIANTVLVTDTQNSHAKMGVIQDDNTISIKIEENDLYVNGKKIPVANFQDHLDKLMAKKSDEEIADMGLKLKIMNPKEGFVDKVNSAFANSRMAKITGLAILPPPPPAPPAAPANAPMPPKAPKADKERKIEIETIEEDGNKKMIKKEVRSEKGKLDMNKEIVYPENADYYLNDKKVSREEALKVLESAKEIQVDIKQTGDGKEVVRIYTE